MDGKLSVERMSEALEVRLARMTEMRRLPIADRMTEVRMPSRMVLADGKIDLEEGPSLSHGLSFNSMTHAKHRLFSLDCPPPAPHPSRFKRTVPGS